MRKLIPPSAPVGEATRLLGGLLVKCIDSGNLRAAQELMQHELFNSATLQAMVLHARRDTETALTNQINILHEQIAEMESGHEDLHADFAALRTVIRERLDQAKRKAQGRIKPAQAARIEAASNTKIVSEFNRLRRNGDSYQSRTICSELAARFGVTADHVRKLRKSWVAGLKPMKRD
ncbi:DNA-binding protein [Burkholderia pseudomallei]|uniref:DNA-binding protein n=1 Tax=Burkholderia pseudomallei TaxID=28450 RepID=UPI000BA80942|nr:DNA-binding protein [Burkholderia pseudomallei]